MRIALLHPTYWPEVRRGSERLIHDLGTSLVERGHDVTLLTSHPGRSSRRREDGVLVLRSRRLPPSGRLGSLEHFLSSAPGAALRLRHGRYDLAHAFHLASGYAAAWARRIGGPPFIFAVHGVPTRESVAGRRGRARILRVVLARAAMTTALSRAAAAAVGEQLGVPAEVAPGGVRCAEYDLDVERSPEPTIVTAAALGDPRKRGELLLAAFARLRESRPDARLLLAGGPDPVLSSLSLPLPAGAEPVEVESTAELARLYARSWVSVLPSVDEAFGLVLIESLAAGTPVVATASGALGEIVNDESIGRLCPPDDPEALAAALGQALELATAPATRERCRAAARRHDWSLVVERYLELYGAVLGRAAATREFAPPPP